MKPVIVLLGALLFFTLTSRAQIIVPNSQPQTMVSGTTPTPHNKVDRALGKANTSINKTNDAVNNTSATASTTVTTLGKAKELAHKLISYFPGSSKNTKINTTIIRIKSAGFGTVKKLNSNVQACSGVKETKIKFSSSTSTITVSHKGTTAALLKSLEKKSGSIFKDNNVDDFKEGKISIILK